MQVAFLQALELYRDICRKELVIEQAFGQYKVSFEDLERAQVAVKSGRNSLLFLLDALRPKQKLTPINGLVSWPDDWTDQHHNGCNDACDMLVGPCVCGAWHSADDEWVKELLKKHHAEIV